MCTLSLNSDKMYTSIKTTESTVINTIPGKLRSYKLRANVPQELLDHKKKGGAFVNSKGCTILNPIFMEGEELPRIKK